MSAGTCALVISLTSPRSIALFILLPKRCLSAVKIVSGVSEVVVTSSLAYLGDCLLRKLSITVFGVSAGATSTPFSFAIRRRLLVINPGTPPSSTVEIKSSASCVNGACCSATTSSVGATSSVVGASSSADFITSVVVGANAAGCASVRPSSLPVTSARSVTPSPSSP